MKEFCAGCVQREAQMEILITKYHHEIEQLKKRVEHLETENDKLSFDLAFYSGSITNLSCNDK